MHDRKRISGRQFPTILWLAWGLFAQGATFLVSSLAASFRLEFAFLGRPDPVSRTDCVTGKAKGTFSEGCHGFPKIKEGKP